MRTPERRRFFKGAVYGNGRKIVFIERNFRIDLRVLKTAVKEFRFVYVNSLFAGIIYFLQRRAFTFVNALNICERKFPFAVKHFSERDMYFLPLTRIQPE